MHHIRFCYSQATSLVLGWGIYMVPMLCGEYEILEVVSATKARLESVKEKSLHLDV